MKPTLSGPSLHGGVLDLRIAEIARRSPGLFSGYGLLMVTADRGRELSTWMQDAVRKRRQTFAIRPFGSAVVVPAEGASWFVGPQGMLTHFDELYVVKADWAENGLAEIPSFTVDLCSFEEGVPQEFQEFFLSIGALRYFTDGSGFATNYCVRSMEDAAALERSEIDARKGKG